MFEYLSQYAVILVTGPQRSGTTICARMIEHDLGHMYIDEVSFSVWNGRRALELARQHAPCVIQGPGLLKDVGLFGEMDDTAVVVMRRDIDSILASQARIRWNRHAAKALSNYPVSDDSPAKKNPGKWIARVKYEWWDNVGRKKVAHAYEIEYESLSSHPMWVNMEERLDFTSRQYRVDQGRAADADK